MIHEHENEILEIMNYSMDCPKDFKCYKNNFENLCEPKGIIGDFVECGCNSCSDDPQTCKYGTSFGNSNFCNCPLRTFVAKKFR